MRLSIRTRLICVVVILSTLSTLPLVYLQTGAFDSDVDIGLLGAIGILIGAALISGILARLMTRNLGVGLSVLETGLLNLKDGEYSSTLAYNQNNEFADLCELYNDTCNQLRQEKRWIYQRELLLDKVTQASPDVLLLINPQQQVVFSNLAARDFFNSTTALEGATLDELSKGAQEGFSTIRDNLKEGLYTMHTADGEHQTWHLSIGEFNLNGQFHQLLILKQLTRELSRQEVAVWKKVIRVISHELNNSLGPISSMLHSGKLLAKNVDENRLDRVFDTIDDRIKHLSEFVQGYGKFAKLPEPKIDDVDVESLLSQLQDSYEFRFENQISDASNGQGQHQRVIVKADAIQLEQLFINLLKNAHESGSAAEDISVLIQDTGHQAVIEVKDHGQGMTDAVMSNALIPFYSTKSSGSGLGLALCREITEAHHGQITLHNRHEKEKGGVIVRVILPK